ncbi:MAG: response regulator transcription factor [Clostridia bacterium]|nr:response regulator transcription factor [Clostridia bacterium]
MRIAVCDDEKTENERLKRMIYGYAAERGRDIVCDCFVSGNELLEREKYDVYFLDYAMPGMNGADLAEKLKNKYSNAVTICFLTSYERAAVEVINKIIYAEAFLVKPADPERLNEVLERLYSRSYFRRVVLKKEKAARVVYPQEVLYVEARNKVCRFCFFDSFEEFPYKITELEKNCLPEELFFRVHRSYIVNLMHVSAYDKKGVTVSNGSVIPMSRFREFQQAFSSYNFRSFRREEG